METSLRYSGYFKGLVATLNFMKLLVVFTVFLTACGADDKTNQPPTISSNISSEYPERSNVNILIFVSDSDGSITSSNVEQTSGPDIDFIYSNGKLMFVSPEVKSDIPVTFTVSAIDNDAVQSAITISTTIVDINREPVVNQSLVQVEFNQTIEFDLGISDPDGDAIAVAITVSPEYGQLTLIENNLFSFTPSLNMIEDQQFEIIVNDNDLEISQVIDIDLIDTTPPIILATTPVSDADFVGVTNNLELFFDDVLAISSVTVNSDSLCSGNIQVSYDNFMTCVPVTLSSTATDTINTILTLTPSDSLEFMTNYAVKVTSNVENFHGTAITASHFTFRTENKDLLITEVSSSKWLSDNRWVEIYNGTTNAIPLLGYQLVTQSISYNDWSDTGIRSFPLSDKILAPGDFMIIQAKHGNGYWQQSVAESNQLILISHDDNIYPKWHYNGGFVELQNEVGATVDLVRFGDNSYQPALSSHWPDNANAQAMEQALGMSIVRANLNADTNSAQDWQVSYFMTPGGKNDVTCESDDDNDGIPDCSEQQGTTFAGLPLYEWGARVGVQDIFIEVDYMDSQDPGVQLHRQALDSVKAAFAAQNIAVHFDVGDLFHQLVGISTADYDLGGGNQVAFYAQTDFIGTAQAPSVLDHKVKNFDIKRRPIFHYMLMANSQREDGSAGSSGYAEIYGNDLIITMGNWGFSLETEASRNTIYNMQAGTIMHELGHNLGLYHGGDSNINNKPNHYSIMNYLYQLDGLSTIGDNEGDRYFSRFYAGNDNCFSQDTELTYNFTSAPADFKISYSHGLNATINEFQIDETLGLSHPLSAPVDFDCNGNSSDLLIDFDINFDGQLNSDLNDFDEWENLNLTFTRYWSGANGGAERSPSQQHKLRNIMHSDVQAIIVEAPPSKALLTIISQTANTHD